MELGRIRAVVVGLVLALALTACGDGEGGGAASTGDPSEQLQAALAAMGDWAGVSLTMRISADEDSLKAFAQDSGELDDEVIGHILGSSIAISALTGDDPALGEMAPFQMAVNLSGDAVFEIRGSGETLYLRLDVPRILGLIGQTDEPLAGIEELLGDVLPPNALRGQWVSLVGAKEFLTAMTGEEMPATASPEQQAALERLATALANAAEVTRDGSDGAGDRLIARGNVREFYAAIKAEADALGLPMDDLPGGADVPDGTVEVIVWVRDGRPTQMEFDLVQLAELDPDATVPDGVERVALLVEISEFSGTIDVPTDAAPLDMQEIIQSFFGMMGGFMGGMPGAGTAPDLDGGGFDPSDLFDEETRAEYCEQVKDMPQEMIREHFADLCPELVQ